MKNYPSIQKSIFIFDTILNGVIALWLILFPVDPLIMVNTPVIVPWVYQVIGLGYLGFAIWQGFQWKKTMSLPTLRFSFWMVILPVLFMGWALISFHQDLKPIARILLWIAEFYMILLSGWYGFLHQKVTDK